MSGRTLITVAGYKKLQSEIQRFTSERSDIIKAIESAKALGDLSENAEYDAAKQAQALNASKLASLQELYANAVVVEQINLRDGAAAFGAKVRLCNLQTEEVVVYTIVSAYEASIEDGLLSIDSPLARAILGRKKSDVIELQLPKGVRSYEILEIEA